MGAHAFGAQRLPDWRRAVLKVGSSLLAAPDGGLIATHAANLARFVADSREQGREVIIVSSGAVAAGRGVLKTDGAGLTQRQALAALGQAPMIALWQSLSDVPVAQVLLSHDDVRNRRRYLNARATLRELLRLGVLPVINENDTVAVDELKLGDNDNLAAVVAALVDADVLLIATDIAGLYDDHPVRNPAASPVPRIESITPVVLRMAQGNAGSLGTGGMQTKLEAASKAASAGIGTALFCGRDAAIVQALSNGVLHGTFVAAHGDKLLARKQWLRNAPAGLHGLRVDAGAARALVERGASLLPGGVVCVEGEFGRGDLIELRLAGAMNGPVLARGLSQYGSADMQRIAGHHSRDIETILGYRYGEAVIHRDDLVVLPQEKTA